MKTVQTHTNTGQAAIALGTLAITLCCASFANGDFTNIGPFAGTHSANYNDVTGTAYQQITLMDGFSELNNLTQGGAIKFEFSSSFNGDLVVPRSAPRMMGQLGILRWDFATGATQFGSYFENNSGTDDAVAEFFDWRGNLLSTQHVEIDAGAQQWVWNGWESDRAFATVIVTGNSTQFLNGFIWYDDTQVTAAGVPEPTGIVAILAMICWMPKRKR